MSFKQILDSRWFPTISKPIIAGALAAGISYVLQHFAGVHVVPGQIQGALNPLIGLLVTAIVSQKGDPVSPITHEPEPEPVTGGTMGEILSRVVQQKLDSDPVFIDKMLFASLPLLEHPLVPVAPEPSPKPAVGHASVTDGRTPVLVPSNAYAPPDSSH